MKVVRARDEPALLEDVARASRERFRDFEGPSEFPYLVVVDVEAAVAKARI